MKKVKITYTVKDKDGFIVDRTTTFPSIPDAMKFVRGLNATKTTLVGTPIIEAA